MSQPDQRTTVVSLRADQRTQLTRAGCGEIHRTGTARRAGTFDADVYSRQESDMSESQPFKPGLEGVVAFETQIAEPDKEGSSLRYRGVDIEDLIGRISFGNVWALLVDGKFGPGPPP